MSTHKTPHTKRQKNVRLLNLEKTTKKNAKRYQRMPVGMVEEGTIGPGCGRGAVGGVGEVWGERGGQGAKGGY